MSPKSLRRLAAAGVTMGALAVPAPASADTLAGLPDTAFGTNGFSVLDVGGGLEEVGGGLVDRLGRSVVVGGAYSSEAGRYQWSVTRTNADGTPDTTWGPGGVRRYTMSGTATGAITAADAVAEAPDGDLVVAGHVYSGGNQQITLLRLEENGTQSTDFAVPEGTVGLRVTPPGLAGSLEPRSIAVRGDGTILLAGEGSASGGYRGLFLARLTSTGLKDATFGADTPATDDGDARTGFATYGSWVTGASAARPYVRGPMSWGNDAYGGDLAVAPNGDITVSGTTINGSTRLAYLLRYDANGRPRTDFGGSEQLAHLPAGSSSFESVTIAQDGAKVVLAGSTGAGFTAARLNADGSPDGAFGGGDGTASAQPTDGFAMPEDVLVDAKGRIVIAGTASATVEGESVDHLAVARLRGDGTPDTDFGAGTEGTIALGWLGDTTGSGVGLDAAGDLRVFGMSVVDGGARSHLVAKLFGEDTVTPITDHEDTDKDTGTGSSDKGSGGGGGGGGQQQQQTATATTPVPVPPLAALPSAQQTRSLLRTQAQAASKVISQVGLRGLTAGYAHPVTVDQAGSYVEEGLVPAASGATATAAQRKKRRMVTVTKGTKRFAAAGRATVRVKPTKAGRKLLKGKRRLTLTIRTTFRPAAGGAAIVTERKVTVRRK